jgi:hypothetical protein
MLRTARSLALTLAATLLLLTVAGRTEAQYVVVRPYCPPTVTYYGPSSVSYYAAPVVRYYAPPTVSYYAVPSAYYYPAPVVTTTRYGLFGRRYATTYYYPPAYVYP